MKRISIGSWAYTIGPYAEHPVDFDTVIEKLAGLGFDGVELGGFPPHPNPGNPGGSDDAMDTDDGIPIATGPPFTDDSMSVAG